MRFIGRLQNSCNTDIKKHALNALLYGLHHGAENLWQAIDQELKAMIKQCEAKKKQISPLFTNIIGGRAIFCGYSLAKSSRDEVAKKTSTWEDTANWYVEAMNKAYDEGYFNRDQKLLRHVAVDHNDHIVNYRLDYQQDCFGAYCALLACSFHKQREKMIDEINNYLNALDDTIYRGFKKEIRPLIKEASPQLDRATLNKQVEKKAREKTDAQMKALKTKLDLKE